MKKGKTLVVYFSKAGENYAVGNIKKGNTRIIAEMIAEETDGTLFQVEPVKDYPKDYNHLQPVRSSYACHHTKGRRAACLHSSWSRIFVRCIRCRSMPTCSTSLLAP